ncbi:hypothetical protein CLOM_g20577 [Closterium sp. NIES-68]|nr:hypothetical protein CLOM_g20577 [Closterium sp. NIES-68]
MPPAAPPRPASPAAATAVASVTPHRVALALLLRLLAGPPPPAVPALPDHPHAHDARAQAPLPRRVRQRLALFLLREAKAAHSWHEPPLSALLLRLAADVAAGEGGAEEGKGEGEGASGGVGRQLVRQLQALQSPDDLFSLAASLRSCVGGSSGPSSQQAGVPVAAGSALGLFLRSLLLALHHLPFQGVCHVLGAIHGYLHHHCMLTSPGASPRPLSFDTITHSSRGPQGSAQRQQARRVGGRAAAEGAAWLSGGGRPDSHVHPYSLLCPHPSCAPTRLALIETVRMAQQETDDVCLVHALSAICHLLSQTASSDARRQLAALGAPSSLQQPTRLEGGLRLPCLIFAIQLLLARYSDEVPNPTPNLGVYTPVGCL